MNLSLTYHEACLVRQHLNRCILHLELELVREEKPAAQRVLERQIEELQAIESRLERIPDMDLPDSSAR